MNPLEGKVALVTGAGQGLGAAISRNLAEAGVTVALGDVRTEAAATLANELEANGRRARPYALDVASRDQVEDSLKRIADDLGGIDIIVNNARVDYTKSFEEVAYEEWVVDTEVSLREPFNVSMAELQ